MNTIKKYGKVAITIEGDYNPNKSYSRLSFVDYNGLTYMSIVDNTTEPPSNGTQWKLISVQGLPGKDGNDGHIPVSLYTITDSDTDIPPVANTNLNPGSIWGAFPSQYSVGDFVWRIDSVKSQDGTELISNWTAPYLATGVKGDKGDAGQDGKDGINGAAGTDSYFHVKFADDEFGTNMNETSGEYIGTYVDNIKEDSDDTTKYTWVKITGAQGPKGDQGVPGNDGADGKTQYLHIAYSNSEDGTVDFSVSDSTDRSYIGQYVDFEIQDSTTPSDYKWTKVKGDAGKDGVAGNDGKGITSTEITYGISASETTTPTSWSASVPTLTKGNYLWTKIVWTYSDQSKETGYQKTYIGVDGSNGSDGLPGKDGVGIVSTTIEYAASTSGTTAPTSGWSTQVPEVPNGSYLWTKITWTYSDNTNENSYSVSKMGETGPQGATGPAGAPGGTGPAGVDGLPGVDFEVRYCLGGDATYNGTSNPSGDSPTGWLTDIPDVTTDKPYIWCIQGRRTYTSTTESTIAWGTPFKLSGTNGINGASGDKGDRGQTVYPAGIFDSSVTYTTDTYKAPYVLDPYDGNYYVLNAIGSWTGSEQDETTNSPAKDYSVNNGKYWLKFDKFEAIFAKIGIISNGLIGSVVFNGDYMFSQQGIDIDGNFSTNYENFMLDSDGVITNHPYNALNLFRPNFFINCATGEASFGLGNIKISDPNGDNGRVITLGGGPSNINNNLAGNSFMIKSDGTAWLSFGNIVLNSDGSGRIGGNLIKWTSEGNITIAGFSITESGIYAPEYELNDGIKSYLEIRNDMLICYNGNDITYWRITAGGQAFFAKQNVIFNSDGSGRIGGSTDDNALMVWDSDGNCIKTNLTSYEDLGEATSISTTLKPNQTKYITCSNTASNTMLPVPTTISDIGANKYYGSIVIGNNATENIVISVLPGASETEITAFIFITIPYRSSVKINYFTNSEGNLMAFIEGNWNAVN